jgi:hypothetical protein
MSTSHPANRVTVAAIAGTLGAMAMLVACSTPRPVDTEVAPAANFSSRRTFAWQDSQASYDPQPPEPDVEAVKRAIRDTVVEQLALKGFRESQEAQADFLVSFHLVVTTVMTEPELCTRRHLIFEYSVSTPALDEIEVCSRDSTRNPRLVRQGTLVVFVVDPITRNLLWQGSVVGGAVSRRDDVETLRGAVAQLLSEFPAGPV